MKFQILKQFCFLFRITRERIGIKTYATESRLLIGPEKCTVCRCVCAPFSPEIFTGLGSEGVKMVLIAAHLNAASDSVAMDTVHTRDTNLPQSLPTSITPPPLLPVPNKPYGFCGR